MSWMIWPENQALSAIALTGIALPLLYAARAPVHALIMSCTTAVAAALRVTARTLLSTAADVAARNRMLLLARGREETRQVLEREFQRVAHLIERDLSGYPALQRQLLENITRLEEDYNKAAEVPPPAPDWIAAIEAIAKIGSGGDGMVEKLLRDVSASLGFVYDKVLDEYRKSCQVRHGILQRFIPFGRALNDTLTRVDRNIVGLQAAARRIDAHMGRYEQVLSRSEGAEELLQSSAMTEFLVSALVVGIAAGGAFVNFWLIARPMSAMVGGGQYIAGDLEVSQVAALVIMLLEATMGLFLLEGLRVTRLFPRIQNMQDRMRRRLMWVAFAFLLVLAGVEVALAVLHDSIAPDGALKAELLVGPLAGASPPWAAKLPVLGQMILAFVLPFVLAFAAIPLEHLVHAARHVGGALLVVVLKAAAAVLRIAGGVLRPAGRLLTRCYDAAIFVPLAIEATVRARRARDATPGIPAPVSEEAGFDLPPPALTAKAGSLS